jgi:transcriptional regulator with XRE-family HTH domain
MARPPTPLNPGSSPLAAFALELRALRDSKGGDSPSVDRISIDTGISRSTLYAALRGTRVPTRHVLAALVRAWGGNEPEWMEKRSAVEAETAAARLHQRANLPTDPQQPTAPSVRVTSPEIEEFWRDVEELRKQNDMPFMEIARRAQRAGQHISMSTLHEWLRAGSRIPPWDRFRALIEALDGDIDEWRQRWEQLPRGLRKYRR